VHEPWLHVQHVERRWQLVGSVGRQRRLEVAGGRAAATRARSESGRRLEALHTGGGYMCGAWSRKAAGSGRWGRQLGGGGHDRGAVRTRAGRGRFERPVL
jgi:hypothetical protein